MTRFMMTLEDAVDLVLYAFEHGKQGDLFVQKSPAATIEVLAKALLELYDSKSEIKVIGTRHGEKLYETLVNREDMVKAEDMGDYYRIPADNRDLNYAQYFSEGEPDVSTRPTLSHLAPTQCSPAVSRVPPSRASSDSVAGD
eukprot:gene49626-67384_t